MPTNLNHRNIAKEKRIEEIKKYKVDIDKMVKVKSNTETETVPKYPLKTKNTDNLEIRVATMDETPSNKEDSKEEI